MENMKGELPAGVDPNAWEEYLEGSPPIIVEEEADDYIATEEVEPQSSRLFIEPVILEQCAGDQMQESNDVPERQPNQQADEPSATSTVKKPKKRKWKQNFVRDESKAKSATKPRKQSRINLFTTEEKKMLTKEVKNYPAIWDITSHDHSNSNVTSSCWNKIATILNRSDQDCKTVWTALRESYRYRERQQKVKASGSEGGEPIAKPSHEDSANDWELSVDLSFLPDTSKKRRSITSFHEPVIPDDEKEAENRLLEGNYAYQTRNNSSTNPYEESVSQLANNVGELIQIQKSLAPQQPQPLQPTFVHHVALANIDRMLQKLSEDEIEDTLHEVTNFIYQKIKNRRDSN